MLFVLAANLLAGRTGRALVAIRDNHIAAEAMGVNNALYKSVTFGVSAAYTGIAGALSAIVIAFVAPDSFDVFLSITLLTGIVIGGFGTISGRRSVAQHAHIIDLARSGDPVGTAEAVRENWLTLATLLDASFPDR